MKPVRNFERIKTFAKIGPNIYIKEIHPVTGSIGMGENVELLLLDGADVRIHILWDTSIIRFSNMESGYVEDYPIDSEYIKTPRLFSIMLANYLGRFVS